MEHLLNLIPETDVIFDDPLHVDKIKEILAQHKMTADDIAESQNMTVVSDGVYHVLEMLHINVNEWYNPEITRNLPKIQNEFTTKLVNDSCQYKANKCKTVEDAMNADHVMCFKCACNMVTAPDELVCLMFCERGMIEYLQYMVNKGLLDRSKTLNCTGAAKHGKVELLHFLREIGCSWNEYTTAAAAEKGNFECLKYAVENGCPMTKLTCDNAARYGHFECLKYAHANGCPIDDLTCWYAAVNGHMECLVYLCGNRCGFMFNLCEDAIEYGRMECAQYLYKNGCPCDKEIVAKYNLTRT